LFAHIPTHTRSALRFLSFGSSPNLETEDNTVTDKYNYLKTDGCNVDVSREVYVDDNRMKRREEYLEERDIKHGKVLYSQLDTEDTNGEEMIPDREATPVEEVVVLKLMGYKLHECLPYLCTCDRKLLYLRYWQDFNQKEAGKVLGIHQTTVSRREKKILENLRVLLEK
jgi:RNA polymerase sigma factor (sigma-70 family)